LVTIYILSFKGRKHISQVWNDAIKGAETRESG